MMYEERPSIGSVLLGGLVAIGLWLGVAGVLLWIASANIVIAVLLFIPIGASIVMACRAFIGTILLLIAVSGSDDEQPDRTAQVEQVDNLEVLEFVNRENPHLQPDRIARQRGVATPAGSSGGRPVHDESPARKAVEVTSLFATASMLMVQSAGRDRGATQQEAIHAFFYGAIDAVCQREGMSDVDSIASACVFFLEFFEMSAEDAGAAAARVMVENPRTNRITQAGGQAILDWMSGRDEHAPLRLFELLGGLKPGHKSPDRDEAEVHPTPAQEKPKRRTPSQRNDVSAEESEEWKKKNLPPRLLG